MKVPHLWMNPSGSVTHVMYSRQWLRPTSIIPYGRWYIKWLCGNTAFGEMIDAGEGMPSCKVCRVRVFDYRKRLRRQLGVKNADEIRQFIEVLDTIAAWNKRKDTT